MDMGNIMSDKKEIDKIYSEARNTVKIMEKKDKIC